jgi:hypothetical protein
VDIGSQACLVMSRWAKKEQQNEKSNEEEKEGLKINKQRGGD